jgi:hypothetical protein
MERDAVSHTERDHKKAFVDLSGIIDKIYRTINHTVIKIIINHHMINHSQRRAMCVPVLQQPTVKVCKNCF